MMAGAKRDSSGRLVKKEAVDTSDLELHFLIPTLTKTLEETLQDTSLVPAPLPQRKRKKPATKSPYFSPPVTPFKSKKLNDVKVEAISAKGVPLSKTLKRRSPSKLSECLEVKTETETGSPAPSQSTPKARSPSGIISCIPFPSLAFPTFGLIQEKLARDPFRLLIAVTFLNRTHGKHAIPVFYALMQKYPTPESLVTADKKDIISIIHHLGLQNQRAATYQTYAKIFLENPPVKGKRYPVRNYPIPESEALVKNDIKKGEILSDIDPRPSAWEIGHITQGPYALDSWRIFCRDILRGVATGWNGEGSAEEGFQPEWMRVLPKDKELRAFLRWMWLKEGFEWDPETGEKEVAEVGLLMAAGEGRIAWDERGGLRVLDEVMEMPTTLTQVGNLGTAEGALGKSTDDG